MTTTKRNEIQLAYRSACIAVVVLCVILKPSIGGHTLHIERYVSDLDADNISDELEDYLLQHYAPYFRWNSPENMGPADIDWYLDRCQLGYYELVQGPCMQYGSDGRSCVEYSYTWEMIKSWPIGTPYWADNQFLGLRRSSPTSGLSSSILDHSGDDVYASGSEWGKWHFRILSPAELQEGEPGSAVLSRKNVGLYGHVSYIASRPTCQVPDLPSFIVVQYCQFAPFNDPHATGDGGQHDGDWMFLEVYLNAGTLLPFMVVWHHHGDGNTRPSIHMAHPRSLSGNEARKWVYERIYAMSEVNQRKYTFKYSPPIEWRPIPVNCGTDQTGPCFYEQHPVIVRCSEGQSRLDQIDAAMPDWDDVDYRPSVSDVGDPVLPSDVGDPLVPISHPVVYVEHGSHEFWPASTHDFCCWCMDLLFFDACEYPADTNGLGWEYQSQDVPNLGEIRYPMPHPQSLYSAILHYNGKWGDWAFGGYDLLFGTVGDAESPQGPALQQGQWKQESVGKEYLSDIVKSGAPYRTLNIMVTGLEGGKTFDCALLYKEHALNRETVHTDFQLGNGTWTARVLPGYQMILPSQQILSLTARSRLEGEMTGAHFGETIAVGEDSASIDITVSYYKQYQMTFRADIIGAPVPLKVSYRDRTKSKTESQIEDIVGQGVTVWVDANSDRVSSEWALVKENWPVDPGRHDWRALNTVERRKVDGVQLDWYWAFYEQYFIGATLVGADDYGYSISAHCTRFGVTDNRSGIYRGDWFDVNTPIVFSEWTTGPARPKRRTENVRSFVTSHDLAYAQQPPVLCYFRDGPIVHSINLLPETSQGVLDWRLSGNLIATWQEGPPSVLALYRYVVSSDDPSYGYFTQVPLPGQLSLPGNIIAGPRLSGPRLLMLRQSGPSQSPSYRLYIGEAAHFWTDWECHEPACPWTPLVETNDRITDFVMVGSCEVGDAFWAADDSSSASDDSGVWQYHIDLDGLPSPRLQNHLSTSWYPPLKRVPEGRKYLLDKGTGADHLVSTGDYTAWRRTYAGSRQVLRTDLKSELTPRGEHYPPVVFTGHSAQVGNEPAYRSLEYVPDLDKFGTMIWAGAIARATPPFDCGDAWQNPLCEAEQLAPLGVYVDTIAGSHPAGGTRLFLRPSDCSLPVMTPATIARPRLCSLWWDMPPKGICSATGGNAFSSVIVPWVSNDVYWGLSRFGWGVSIQGVELNTSGLLQVFGCSNSNGYSPEQLILATDPDSPTMAWLEDEDQNTAYFTPTKAVFMDRYGRLEYPVSSTTQTPADQMAKPIQLNGDYVGWKDDEGIHLAVPAVRPTLLNVSQGESKAARFLAARRGPELNTQNNTFAILVDAVDNRLAAGGTATLTARVTGGVPPLTYRWEVWSDASGWQLLSVAPRVTVAPMEASLYRVTATDTSQPALSGNAAVLLQTFHLELSAKDVKVSKTVGGATQTGATAALTLSGQSAPALTIPSSLTTISPGQGNDDQQSVAIWFPASALSDGKYDVTVINPDGSQADTLFDALDSSADYPGVASGPSPSPGTVVANEQNVVLSWSAGAGALAYSVYLGAQPDNLQLVRQTESTSTALHALDRGLRLYWRIDAHGATRTSQGSIWAFNTPALPPEPASGLSPSNGQEVQAGRVTLRWDESAHADQYNVYFGTTSPPPLNSRTAMTSLDVTGLLPAKTYYWRVDAIGAGGTQPGQVVSFRAVPPPAPPALSIAVIQWAPGTTRRVTFTAMGEAGAFDALTQWNWNFGDSSIGEPILEITTEHVYRRSGTYVVTLTARSIDGRPATAQVNVTVRITVDYDGDHDVDQRDVQVFIGCVTGPMIPQTDPVCQICDVDGDGDVDQSDFGFVQRCISGPGVSVGVPCAP